MDAAKWGNNAGGMRAECDGMGADAMGLAGVALGLWLASNWTRIFLPWAGGTRLWVYGYQEKQTPAHGRDFGY